ncbi:hypothetical protein A6V39_05355 [Candidatus Mycoplasma haematobovis]|uniref:Uncharacterized protein n=1 Tax=Candidatus Mycoplasma haematobovis TaxID=432608 RepID=A0A1A9QB33_9MOLU|nr:hypothetical protein [Candidatus Mycoplasma haematobovis]OAL09762.1 hypothetical protein A6V39_05355 [Candidatus Mycoplasma haematobovis]
MTERQEALLKLGKQMKEIIKLSETLTFKGHPVIDKWVSQVKKLIDEDFDLCLFNSFSSYEFAPHKSEVFDILTYLRRMLKKEGIFSEDLVK